MSHPLFHPKHLDAATPSTNAALADLLSQANTLQAAANKIRADVAILRQPAPPPPTKINWPSYTGTANLLGVSPVGKVSVYNDPSLGSEGLQNAKDLLADADRIVALNNQLFGTTGAPTNVIVFALGGATDGTGGADHMACDYKNGGNIEVCAAFGSSARCSALFEAELSECAMNAQLCGLSTGEALSRWCAAVASNNALSDFASAPTWAKAGMPNWVDRTETTDQDYKSIGCGMAFISFLISCGAPLAKIAQAMVALGDSGTLAQLYAKLGLGQQTNAWATFEAAVKQLPNGITSDDPFGK